MITQVLPDLPPECAAATVPVRDLHRVEDAVAVVELVVGRHGTGEA